MVRRVAFRFAPAPLCTALRGFDSRGCFVLLWAHAQKASHSFLLALRYARERIGSLWITHQTTLAQQAGQFKPQFLDVSSLWMLRR